MTIDRRQLFTLAWKSAKGTVTGYRNLRAAFAAALRRVWGLVKAMVAEEARRPAKPVQPERNAFSDWWNSNPHRAAAVARRNARLGSYVVGCW
jgi:hypothetical protein